MTHAEELAAERVAERVAEPRPVLVVRDLQLAFHTDHGVVRAVNGISFDVRAGETVGMVGESGSGKSVSNLALLGLVPQPPGRLLAGEAWFEQRDLLRLNARELQDVRGRQIGMVFQDPMTSLNPFLTIGTQLSEITQRHWGYSAQAARDHAISMLERVGIRAAAERFRDYPHQFSGGMRQRVLIAMALACRPQLLIADEPTTALDVSVQAQILDLIQELAEQQGTAVIMITHNMGVVARTCQRVLVMYAGRIVEEAPVHDLFAAPQHPYTQGLLASIPSYHRAEQRLAAIPGQPPDLTQVEHGCPFAPRCAHRVDRCVTEHPPLTWRTASRRVACWVDLPGRTEQESAEHAPT